VWSGILRRVYWCLVVKITKSSSGIPALALFYQHCSFHLPLYLLIPFPSYLDRHQHKNTIQALSWSPNGNLVASASRDQTVRVFDIRAMKEFRILKGHKKEVCCTLPFPLSFCFVLMLVCSCCLAPRPSVTCIWRIGRRDFALGLVNARGEHFHLRGFATARHIIPSSRLECVVARISPIRAHPCQRFE